LSSLAVRVREGLRLVVALGDPGDVLEVDHLRPLLPGRGAPGLDATSRVEVFGELRVALGVQVHDRAVVHPRAADLAGTFTVEHDAVELAVRVVHERVDDAPGLWQCVRIDPVHGPGFR
jgi:hypothetical protein